MNEFVADVEAPEEVDALEYLEGQRSFLVDLTFEPSGLLIAKYRYPNVSRAEDVANKEICTLPNQENPVRLISLSGNAVIVRMKLFNYSFGIAIKMLKLINRLSSAVELDFSQRSQLVF